MFILLGVSSASANPAKVPENVPQSERLNICSAFCMTTLGILVYNMTHYTEGILLRRANSETKGA